MEETSLAIGPIELLIILLILVFSIGFTVICFMKGKPVFAILNLFVGIFGIVGVCRLAKPNSLWAKRYDQEKLQRSMQRFPEAAEQLGARPGP